MAHTTTALVGGALAIGAGALTAQKLGGLSLDLNTVRPPGTVVRVVLQGTGGLFEKLTGATASALADGVRGAGLVVFAQGVTVPLFSSVESVTLVVGTSDAVVTLGQVLYVVGALWTQLGGTVSGVTITRADPPGTPVAPLDQGGFFQHLADELGTVVVVGVVVVAVLGVVWIAYETGVAQKVIKSARA